MALIKLSGSGSATSSFVENEGVKPVVDLRCKYDATSLLADESVQKSYFNEDYETEELAEAISDALATTVQGSSIFVTYFHQVTNNVDDRSHQADNVIEYDTVHHAYFKILHFEMKVQGSFEFNFDQEPATSSWEGKAYTYPYFKPQVGDYFLYEVEEGVMGLFKVNSVRRLSIRKATWSEISFELVKLPVTDDDEVMKNVLESVSETYVFDTEAFLASNGALLTTDEAETINTLMSLRTNLIRYYYSKFYDYDYHHTFIRPDGIYDPYMIEFWYRLEEPCKGAVIPARLINKPYNFNRSIWWRFLYPDYKIRDTTIQTYCIDTWRCRVWETTINSLINKKYILIHEANDKKLHGKCELLNPYPLSEYNQVEIGNERFCLIELQYLEDRVADTDLLVEEILTTPNKELMEMFYETPFLIFVCDCVIKKLKYGC